MEWLKKLSTWAKWALGIFACLTLLTAIGAVVPEPEETSDRGDNASDELAQTERDRSNSKPAREKKADRKPRQEKRPKPRVRRRSRPRKAQRSKPKEPDRAAQAQRFFTRMDDYAIALDEAIAQRLDGKPAGARRISRLRIKIQDRLNAWLVGGGDTSIGGNLLLSAAFQARDASRADKLPRLVDARREITSARFKLAKELGD